MLDLRLIMHTCDPFLDSVFLKIFYYSLFEQFFFRKIFVFIRFYDGNISNVYDAVVTWQLYCN